MTETKRLATASIHSFLVHALFLGLIILINFLTNNGYFPAQRGDVRDRSIEVERISQEELKKYRVVGVKNGKKNFSIKTPRGDMGKNKKSQRPAGAKGLSLRNLQTKIDPKSLKEISKLREPPRVQEKKEKEPIIKKEIKAAESGIPLTALRSKEAMQNFARQEGLRQEMLKNLSTQSSQADVLKRTGFNLHFEPPEGVSEDELNSVEKIFYSFQKRTFLSYVNAFLSSYHSKVLNTPQVQTAMRTERHLLTGKIDFDREGNILRIKILRSSHNDDIHELFETTLREIRSLPNPPKAIIENKEQFTIYYQLRINQ